MHWFSPHRGDWTDKDYVLSLALTIYEDGLCSCGQPTVVAHHVDNDGWYEAQKVQCYSCASRELATANSGSEPYTPDPGEKVYAVLDTKGKAEAAARRTPHTTPSP